MKTTILTSLIFLFLLSCKKDEAIVPAPQANAVSTAKMATNGNTTSYWVDFNPYAYTNEYWSDATLPNKVFGSCLTAAVVLVENHLSGASSISSTAMKTKNAVMRGSVSPTYSSASGGVNRYFYILAMWQMIDQFNRDGYTPSNISTSNRTTAISNLTSALQNGKWVVALSNYIPNGIGHAYPIYSVDIVRNANTTINETSSVVKVIDSWDGSWTPTTNSTNWSRMYKSFSLKSLLDAMNTGYGTYYLLSVKK